MISENDSSGDEEVPLEVSNETARKQTLESIRLQSEAACKSKKGLRSRKKVETVSSFPIGDGSYSSDRPSDAIVSEMKSTDNRDDSPEHKAEEKEYLDELMTDDESNISEAESDSVCNFAVTRPNDRPDHMDDESLESNTNGSTFESEMNLLENKGSSQKRKALSSRKNVPVQYKNGTNISSVNENSSSSIESLSNSTSRPYGVKKFTIRRADKANRVANRSLYRKPGAALALNFKERMLYSTTRIARINASTLLANRERRNHI